MVVRNIGVWSAARLYGAMSATIGLIFGAFLAVASVFGAALGGPDQPGWLAGVFGLGGLIILPIFYGILGLITGAIGALLYNLFAAMVGGVEIDVS